MGLNGLTEALGQVCEERGMEFFPFCFSFFLRGGVRGVSFFFFFWGGGLFGGGGEGGTPHWGWRGIQFQLPERKPGLRKLSLDEAKLFQTKIPHDILF